MRRAGAGRLSRVPLAPDLVTAVVLAGGRATRMGGQDKGLLECCGRPLVARVVEALRPQVAEVIVSANRNPEVYRRITGCPVVADETDDFPGPLAGIAAGLAASHTPLVLVCPCDAPFIAPALVERLAAGLTVQAEIAVAHDGQRLQPLPALLRRSTLDDLRACMAAGGHAVYRWYAARAVATVDFTDRADDFANINTAQDLQAAERRLCQATPG
jgi:molybdopterin-guanine dinucleotide biosynthesis protein A